MTTYVSIDETRADSPHLVLRRNLFATPLDAAASEAHITRRGRTVTIQNLTIFPGILTPWRAIRWGLVRLIPYLVRGKRALYREADYDSAAAPGQANWFD